MALEVAAKRRCVPSAFGTADKLLHDRVQATETDPRFSNSPPAVIRKCFGERLEISTLPNLLYFQVK